MDPKQYDDEHDHTKDDDTCPRCGQTEGHSDDCDFCPECGEDCSAQGLGHSRNCSNWEPPDPPGWEGGFARNH